MPRRVKTNAELSAEEAAAFLGVHRQTICRWVSRGLLQPVSSKGRGNGKQFFSRSEIERFIEEEGKHDAYWWRQIRR